VHQRLQLQQIIPSHVCLTCDVCCRFLEPDSFLAPIFTESEREAAIVAGAEPELFHPMADGKSGQITLKPHDEMYICPFFAPETSECTIYPIRPLDCQIYPFAVMFNEDGTQVLLGVDMLCPFGEAQLQTEPFQRYIDHIASYLESEEIVQTIASNCSLIGRYQDTVVVVRVLEKLNRRMAEDAATTQTCR
jgi:uncharacterized protein